MKGKVTCELLNLRKTPEKANNVVTLLNKGDEVTVLENSKDWLKVKAGDAEGYVMAEYVELEPEEKPKKAPKKKEKGGEDEQTGATE